MNDPRTSRQGRLARWDMAREIAGPALTAATAFSLVRVFAGDSWIAPVLIAVVASHLLALAIRRIGWGMPVSALASGVGLVLTVTWTRYWDTTAWGMPVADTLAALADDVEVAWTAFGNLNPPVAPLNGFTVSAMVVIWLIAFLLDDCWAMRSRALSESLLLPIAAIGFVGLVGDDRHRILTIGVFTAALLYFAVVHRVAARTADIAWLGGEGRASAGRRSLLIAGAAMAAFALGGAVAAVPVLSSDESSLVDLAFERGGESSGRVVISPLVDIRGRLVNQTDTPMFRVRAEERSYWRLTSLDQFDGRVWTSRAEYASRPTQLPSLVQSGSSVEESVQHFTIEQLGAVWLPAAFEPRSLVSTSDAVDRGDISYEPSSSTLIVGRSLASADGLSYTVTSALPRFDPEGLEAIPLDAALDAALNAAAGPNTSLPSDFSPRVRALAAQLTAGSGSGYEQALALQSFFRNGSFVYDTDVSSGHSGNRIEDFLSARRGYCEQFAGTFAAMARSVGLPTRVAVGFTVGEADPDDPDLYRVRGRHAHAWPEVFLAGVGWVAFEPTPGRGAPGAQNHTGLAEAQAVGRSGPEPSGAEPAPGAARPFGSSTDFESFVPPDSPAPGDAPPAAGDNAGGLSWRVWTAILVPSLAALAALAVPWLKRLRDKRRFLSTTGNRGKIKLLWAETVESLALLKIAPRPDETYLEFADRAIDQIPLHSPDLRQLGELAAAATFAPWEPTDHTQWLARTWSLSVRSEVNFRVSRWQKMATAFNPRPLLASRRQKTKKTRAAGGPRNRPERP